MSTRESPTPRVSVIVPTHNRRRLLEETIESVRAQSETNWQLVVVDDASSDDTWPYLSGLSDPRIHAIHLEKNSERARARNRGLEAATGALVLFLDDDDLLPPDALSLHLSAFERYPKVLASIGGHTLFDDKGLRWRRPNVSQTQERSILDELLFGWVAVSGQTLFRRDAFESVGGWNETPSVLTDDASGRPSVFAEDHELFLRLAPRGTMALLAESVLDYRVHGQWRPEGQEDIATRMRELALERLDERSRARGARMLRARALAARGEAALGDGPSLKAFAAYARVLLVAPKLYRSPLTRRQLWSALLRSSFGEVMLKRGVRLLRPRPRN